MNHQHQAEELLHWVPPSGIPPAAMNVVVELLLSVSQSLTQEQYWVVSYGDPAWMTVTVGPDRWLPAFAAELDARHVQPSETTVQQINVLPLLFRGLGLPETRGLIFYDEPGNRRQGKRVDCQRLLQEIQQRWLNSSC